MGVRPAGNPVLKNKSCKKISKKIFQKERFVKKKVKKTMKSGKNFEIWNGMRVKARKEG